jgi:hypothetical protein
LQVGICIAAVAFPADVAGLVRAAVGGAIGARNAGLLVMLPMAL